MPHARNQHVEIYYETHGSRQARPVVLVMGLGVQLIHWPQEFIDRLLALGHFVVLLDNRDVGLSTSFRSTGKIDWRELLAAISEGREPQLPYRMSDMAQDVLAVMDALELRSAHLVGASMGGYISQRLAIAQPERVRSLTAIMSTTGAPDLPKTRPDVTARLFAPPPATREEKIARMLELNRAICANAADFSETRLLEKMTLSEQRGHDPIAVARQMAALLAGGSTDAGLRQLRTPALVMHGALDPLLPVGCGLRIHECLEGSKLWIDENLGHYLAARVIEPMTERISELTAASDAADR